VWQALKERVARLKRETVAIWFACRDRRTPWGARMLGLLIIGYALSPIDLIPDFIPVIGYLDELILIPVGLWMLLKLIPEQVLYESREKAEVWLAAGNSKPRSALGALIVILIWIMIAWWLVLIFATPLGE
jgi:uncharacterized membrane protein YkvA (DUF1232 family)